MTSLSENVWELEDKSINLGIKWEILQRAKPYQPGSEDCQLCLAEIHYILFKPQEVNVHNHRTVTSSEKETTTGNQLEPVKLRK